MVENLEIGLRASNNIIVQHTDSATAFGSGLVDVYATPAMIALMEKTALECVTPILPDGFTTVGIEICIHRIKATTIEKKVSCTAEFVEIDREKLVFEVSSKDEEGEIGFGKHTRFIIEQEKFMAKLS